MEGSFLITRASLEAIAEDREKGVSTLLNWQKEALGFKRSFLQRKNIRPEAPWPGKSVVPLFPHSPSIIAHSSRTANTSFLPEHSRLSGSVLRSGQTGTEIFPANAVFPCLSIYIERKTVFSIMQGSSLPPCPPTAIHTWSWQSSASAPLPYAPSFPGGTRRKKTGCRGSTRNFPCPRPRREARRHNRKPCLKYSAENRKIFLRLPRTVNRRQNRRPGAKKNLSPGRAC